MISPDRKRASEGVADPGELDRLADRLDPRQNRQDVLAGLDRLFRSGTAPDPWPEGPHSGRLLATSTWPVWDSLVMGVARGWMPWMGKRFDPVSARGANLFLATPAARVWLRTVFPTHRSGRVTSGAIEAFPFRLAAAPSEMDADLIVLRIDYDFAENPELVRRVVDEVVQIAPGHYLGQAVVRLRGRSRRGAFFSLRR